MQDRDASGIDSAYRGLGYFGDGAQPRALGIDEESIGLGFQLPFKRTITRSSCIRHIHVLRDVFRIRPRSGTCECDGGLNGTVNFRIDCVDRLLAE